MAVDDASALLGASGPFAGRLQGYQPREQQQCMAAAVERTLADYGTLVVEAGTGVGKTFAYLVPAVMSGGRVIVSTGTRNLQDQLYARDLPLVLSALGRRGLKTALLKGRANYLCPHRLRLALGEGRFADRRQVHWLHRIERWSNVTSSGDIGELSEVPEDSDLWPRVTSTVENCLGAECVDYDECFVVRARRQAQEADIVVINHHLFFADLALREEGFGELLPSANAFILDEAHQLPEVASNFFGITLGSRQLLELARDTVAEQLTDAPDMRQLRERAERLEKTVADLRLALGGERERGPWARCAARAEVTQAMDDTSGALADLDEALELAAERGKGLESCARRAAALTAQLERFHAPEPGQVQWYETYTRAFALHVTPLDVGEPFCARREGTKCAWVFTSATLAVDGRFDHFTARLGLDEPVCEQLDSPFDYANNALLYLPPALPEPNDRRHTAAVVQAALPLIAANPGGTFLLFTSHRALREAASMLEGRIDRPLFVQGSAPRGELLERFREAGDGVLLGAQSFWEGVDVRGRALTCVIIDKLPFASPGDPVLEARLDAVRQNGGNPFMEVQVPQAVIALKQGVGRLIRDVDDCGVLAICDPRLTTKAYGRVFLQSLPPIPLVRRVDEVTAFLEGMQT
ncbi:MAG: ATP-dependent DNA helicase [Chromatiales bacterium]|nr:ATP-dependent DNA helicase [Chromatiales bacterium]